MGQDSKIQWTDATWNPIAGCSRCSPGCQHCYAETMSKRLAGMARADLKAGRNTGRKAHYLNVVKPGGGWNHKVDLVPEALADPLAWKRTRRVFVNSMSDLFHEDVPFDFVDKVFAVMALCPQHVFQVLTKRPERMAEYFIDLDRRRGEWDEDEAEHEEFLIQNLFDNNEVGDADDNDPIYRRSLDWLNRYNARNLGWPLPGVWLGTSVEDQQRANERIPHLLNCPAAVRFLSCEPLLGEINLRRIRCVGAGFMDAMDGRGHDGSHTGGTHFKDDSAGPAIDWIIAGGESGRSARPCIIGHIRSIVRQCEAANVACFVKQLGSKPVNREGVAHPLKDRKGGDIYEWPEDLRVRQFPSAPKTA